MQVGKTQSYWLSNFKGFRFPNFPDLYLPTSWHRRVQLSFLTKTRASKLNGVKTRVRRRGKGSPYENDQIVSNKVVNLVPAISDNEVTLLLSYLWRKLDCCCPNQLILWPLFFSLAPLRRPWMLSQTLLGSRQGFYYPFSAGGLPHSKRLHCCLFFAGRSLS